MVKKAKRYPVRIRVISQKGTCLTEHKVGQEWILGDKTPEGICIAAYNALYPNARVLMFGGTLPWAPDPDMMRNACPDAQNPVVFEMRRLKRKPKKVT